MRLSPKKNRKSLDVFLPSHVRSVPQIRVMKKRINQRVKAHLIRGAFYLLLLVAVCVIPFALAQPTTGKQSTSTNTTQLVTSSDTGGDAGAVPMPGFPTGGAIYNQYDNPATKPPPAIGSQNLEPAMAAFHD